MGSRMLGAAGHLESRLLGLLLRDQLEDLRRIQEWMASRKATAHPTDQRTKSTGRVVVAGVHLLDDAIIDAKVQHVPPPPHAALEHRDPPLDRPPLILSHRSAGLGGVPPEAGGCGAELRGGAVLSREHQVRKILVHLGQAQDTDSVPLSKSLGMRLANDRI